MISTGTGGVFLRRLRARVSEEPTGFLWVDDKIVAASGLPASRGQLEWLVRQGVKSILTLTENALPLEWTVGLSLNLHHVPMRDHEPPDVSSLRDAVGYITAEVAGGRVVLVHCLAGRGRTMCALAAYLVASKGMSPQEAIAALRTLKPGAVEMGQEESVASFAAASG